MLSLKVVPTCSFNSHIDATEKNKQQSALIEISSCIQDSVFAGALGIQSLGQKKVTLQSILEGIGTIQQLHTVTSSLPAGRESLLTDDFALLSLLELLRFQIARG